MHQQPNSGTYSDQKMDCICLFTLDIKTVLRLVLSKRVHVVSSNTSEQNITETFDADVGKIMTVLSAIVCAPLENFL